MLRNAGLRALVILLGFGAVPAVATAATPTPTSIYAGVWVNASRPSTAGQFQSGGTRLANPGAPWGIQADYALRAAAGTNLLLATYGGSIFVVDPTDLTSKVQVPPLPVANGGLPSVYVQPLALGPNGTKIAYIGTDRTASRGQGRRQPGIDAHSGWPVGQERVVVSRRCVAGRGLGFGLERARLHQGRPSRWDRRSQHQRLRRFSQPNLWVPQPELVSRLEAHSVQREHSRAELTTTAAGSTSPMSPAEQSLSSTSPSG